MARRVLVLRSHFGVTERELFHEWSYWQYRLYMKAADELLTEYQGGRTDGGSRRESGASGGKPVKDARNATAAQLRAMGIPVEGG